MEHTFPNFTEVSLVRLVPKKNGPRYLAKFFKFKVTYLLLTSIEPKDYRERNCGEKI
jgi:hypothetical protein